jgi:hypothetical protein
MGRYKRMTPEEQEKLMKQSESNNKKALSLSFQDQKCIIKADTKNLALLKEGFFKKLKFDNIHNFLSEIDKEALYQFVNKPFNAHLKENTNGTVGGVWYGNDKKGIVQHAQLKSVSTLRTHFANKKQKY